MNLAIGFIILTGALICLPIGKKLKEKKKEALRTGGIPRHGPGDWLYDFAVNGLFIGTILILWSICSQ